MQYFFVRKARRRVFVLSLHAGTLEKALSGLRQYWEAIAKKGELGLCFTKTEIVPINGRITVILLK